MNFIQFSNEKERQHAINFNNRKEVVPFLLGITEEQAMNLSWVELCALKEACVFLAVGMDEVNGVSTKEWDRSLEILKADMERRSPTPQKEPVSIELSEERKNRDDEFLRLLLGETV